MSEFYRTLQSFRVGDRVELHPGLDLWMMGAKYGEVTKIGRKLVHVRLDKLPKRTFRFNPSRLAILASPLTPEWYKSAPDR